MMGKETKALANSRTNCGYCSYVHTQSVTVIFWLTTEILHICINPCGEIVKNLMAGVAQLVELWIVIPMPLSNISDLAPKMVRTSADGWSECGRNADQMQTNRKEKHGKL